MQLTRTRLPTTGSVPTPPISTPCSRVTWPAVASQGACACASPDWSAHFQRLSTLSFGEAFSASPAEPAV